MAATPYLTVAEVSDELGISKSGVYKLIQRGRLRAIKRSERGTLVPRLALDAYRRRLSGERPHAPPAMEDPTDVATLAATFRGETGNDPEGWVAAWKTDRLEDSVVNMRHTIQALAILAAQRDPSRDAPMAGASSVAR